MGQVRVLILSFVTMDAEERATEVLVSDHIVPWKQHRPCRIYALREDGRVSAGLFIDDCDLDGAISRDEWGRRHVDTRTLTIPAGFDFWTQEEVAAFVGEAFRMFNMDVQARVSLRLAAERAGRDMAGRFASAWSVEDRGVLA